MKDKTLVEMADKILADGLVEFIGDCLNIEIATKMVGRHLDYGCWQVFKKIVPKRAPAPPRAIDYGEALPGLPGSVERINAMRDLYAPAVDELTARQAEAETNKREIQPINCPSAFRMTFDEFCDSLADKLATLGLDWRLNEKTGQYEAYRIEKTETIHRPRKSPKKLSE